MAKSRAALAGNFAAPSAANFHGAAASGVECGTLPRLGAANHTGACRSPGQRVSATPQAWQDSNALAEIQPERRLLVPVHRARPGRELVADLRGFAIPDALADSPTAAHPAAAPGPRAFPSGAPRSGGARRWRCRCGRTIRSPASPPPPRPRARAPRTDARTA